MLYRDCVCTCGAAFRWPVFEDAAGAEIPPRCAAAHVEGRHEITGGDPVELRLNCDAVTEKPVNFDFSEGFGETWETIERDFSDDPEAALSFLEDRGVSCDQPPEDEGEDPDDYDDLREEWEEAIIEQAVKAAQEDPDDVAPMMNYYYPLPGYRGDAGAHQAADILPSCVLVEVGRETALALAGGGMDFSPDICAAYVALGYWPPAHFAGWPSTCGMRYGGNVYLAAVCAESLRMRERWSEGEARRVEEAIRRSLEKEATHAEEA